MKSCALADLAAFSISASLAVSVPYTIFSLIVPTNSVGSWLTSPMCRRRALRLYVLMSLASIFTTPLSGS
uniref:Uncharacterized protein n=1 Tax=Arundo donax TaxID=35708 RepID=A0A0A9HJ63_ARUDO